VDVLVLGELEVEALLDLEDLLDGLQDGFAQLTRGEVNAPDRNEIPMPADAFLLSMPAHREGSEMMVKIVTVFEANLERGLPSHFAVINAFDPETGACTAMIDGTYITAVRTAGSAAVSARLLAREDARRLAIVGAGVQGRSHLRTVPLTRGFEDIAICSLHHEDAERLAGEHPLARAERDVEAAVRDADVVALATHAAAPVIDAAWLKPGAHVSSVGYNPPVGELPADAIDRGRLFVETRIAFEPTPVGCAELAGRDPASATELGEVVTGARPGRTSPDEITVYKAMGHAIEDLVAADLVLAAARRTGAGRAVEVMAGRPTG